MKFVILLSVLLLAGCVSPQGKVSYNARVYTINNEEIDLKNLHLWEKKFQFPSQNFHPRWRGSLERIDLGFAEIAMAMEVDDNLTKVIFRDGHTDYFQEFFEDEYNLRGWSPYGQFDINATLIRGIIFLDENGNPVGDGDNPIPPIVQQAESTDRFVTFDGDIISGKLLGDRIMIRTNYGEIFLNKELISEIRINREQEEVKEMVQFKNGDILSGYIEPPRFEMELEGGQKISMGVDELSRILFSRPVATEDVEKR